MNGKCNQQEVAEGMSFNWSTANIVVFQHAVETIVNFMNTWKQLRNPKCSISKNKNSSIPADILKYSRLTPDGVTNMCETEKKVNFYAPSIALGSLKLNQSC